MQASALGPLWLALPVCLYAWPLLASARVAWSLCAVPAAAFAVWLSSTCISVALLGQFELLHLQLFVGVLCACAAATLLTARLQFEMQRAWLLVAGCSIALLQPYVSTAFEPALNEASVAASLSNTAALAMLLLLCRAAARQRPQATLSARLMFGAVLALFLAVAAPVLAPVPEWPAASADARATYSDV